MGITNKQRGKQLFSGGIQGLGEWVDVPFKASNFFGQDGMIWTVDSTPYNRYCEIGSVGLWQGVTFGNLSGAMSWAVNFKAPTIIADRGPGMAQGQGQVLGCQVGPVGDGDPVPWMMVYPMTGANFVSGFLSIAWTILFPYGDPANPALARQARAEVRTLAGH